jgi:hypothetical protein
MEALGFVGPESRPPSKSKFKTPSGSSMVCRRRRSWYVIRAFYFKAIYTVVEQKLKLEAGFFFFFADNQSVCSEFSGKKRTSENYM